MLPKVVIYIHLNMDCLITWLGHLTPSNVLLFCSHQLPYLWTPIIFILHVIHVWICVSGSKPESPNTAASNQCFLSDPQFPNSKGIKIRCISKKFSNHACKQEWLKVPRGKQMGIPPGIAFGGLKMAYILIKYR